MSLKLKGTRPLSKAFFVQCKLYRYICLILLKNSLLKFDANEFLWMCIEYHL